MLASKSQRFLSKQYISDEIMQEASGCLHNFYGNLHTCVTNLEKELG